MVDNLKTGWLGIYEEEQAFDNLFKFGDCFTEFTDFVSRQSTPEQQAIDAVRRELPFDDGWAFWYAVDKVFGAQIAPGPQDGPDCVGYSAGLSLIDLMAQEIFIKGEAENGFIPFVPWLYGSGRVYIGNNSLRGGGSLGSWQIASDQRFGVLPADVPNLPPTPANEPAEPNAATIQLWGSSRAVLDKWKHLAEPHKIEVGTRCTNAQQAKDAVCTAFRPLTIASNWGFRKKGFDSKYGITLWTRSGSWAHQMHVRGIFEIKGAWFVYIGNQWGSNYHGKVGDGFPLGGFVITFDEFARWVPDAAVYARGQFQGRKSTYGGFV